MKNAVPLLPVHERFYTWQGEGHHSGRAAFFVRLFGCPVRCPWCDSAGTWHPDWVPNDGVDMMSAHQIATEAKKARAPMIVVTGGEPAIHDLRDLTAMVANLGIMPHLETSGAFQIRGSFSWITVSPKRHAMTNEDRKVMTLVNLEKAAEWKLIIESPEDIANWWHDISIAHRGQPVWLHPEWSQRENQGVLRAITDAVKDFPEVFRAGWQMHKLYAADTLDDRSRPNVPLGGDPNRGY